MRCALVYGLPVQQNRETLESFVEVQQCDRSALPIRRSALQVQHEANTSFNPREGSRASLARSVLEVVSIHGDELCHAGYGIAGKHAARHLDDGAGTPILVGGKDWGRGA